MKDTLLAKQVCQTEIPVINRCIKTGQEKKIFVASSELVKIIFTVTFRL